MSSLKKRATWGMVIGMICLVAGIVLLCSANDALDHAFQKSFTRIGKGDEGEIIPAMVGGILPLMGGAGLTILGLVLFPVFLATWIRNPPPGSKLGFRGWKTPEQMTEGDVAQEKAWRAILWGQLATQSWLLQICLGGYRPFLSHWPLGAKMLLFLILFYLVFYALGIRLCRRRTPASVAVAPRSWKFALVINYGGLAAFLSLIVTLFLIRARA